MAPASGLLRVSARSTGVEIDPDGYTIRVDQEDGISLGANDVIEGLRPRAGTHAVALSGMAPNCTVAGDNPRVVVIFEQETSSVDFQVSCNGPVGHGTLIVETNTSGVPTSSSGYSVAVDPALAVAATLNDTLIFDGLTEGEHLVRLSVVPTGCFLTGENPQTISISPGDTTRAVFEVNCWPPPSGRIAFERSFQLQIVRADGSRLLNLSEEYEFLGLGFGSADFPSWSPDGRQLVVQSDIGIIVIDADPGADTPPPIPLASSDFFIPAWSPDGKTVLLMKDAQGRGELFSVDVHTHGQRKLFTPSDDVSIVGRPAWSPDGGHIAFATATTGSGPLVGDIFVIDASGANPSSLLGGLTGRLIQDVAWSGDASHLAFVASRSPEASGDDIFVLTLPSGPPVSVTGGRVDLPGEPSFSPDGNRIVFTANHQLFVINVDGSGLTQLTVPPGDSFDGAPAWGP